MPIRKSGQGIVSSAVKKEEDPIVARVVRSLGDSRFEGEKLEVPKPVDVRPVEEKLADGRQKVRAERRTEQRTEQRPVRRRRVLRLRRSR